MYELIRLPFTDFCPLIGTKYIDTYGFGRRHVIASFLFNQSLYAWRKYLPPNLPYHYQNIFVFIMQKNYNLREFKGS